MANPLAQLGPTICLLQESIKFLPAVGGATEELVRPDQEEIDDTLIHSQLNKITDFAEVPTPSIDQIYRPAPPLFRREKHLFRFFIDGSFRTYFLGTGVEGNRSFPVMLAQIGGAVIHRDDEGRLSTVHQKRELILLLPASGAGISDTVWHRLEVLQGPDFFRLVNYELPDPLTEDKKDPRDKAGGKVRAEMHELEAKLIETTNGQRNENNWLIIDGATKFDRFIQAPYLIGVAKAFSKQPEFIFGGTKTKRDVTSILAGLPHCHRTVAFSAYDGKVAFWYVRIREQRNLDYPLMGVLKVELPTPDQKPVPAELIDLLSCALVAERSVSPYGKDKRWHCTIYPIYIAEQVIKNSFFSNQVILNACKLQGFTGG
ncbi:MAG: hypothetical protein ABIK54_06000 [candidate division WOR-3 bacterium]